MAGKSARIGAAFLGLLVGLARAASPAVDGLHARVAGGLRDLDAALRRIRALGVELERRELGCDWGPQWEKFARLHALHQDLESRRNRLWLKLSELEGRLAPATSRAAAPGDLVALSRDVEELLAEVAALGEGGDLLAAEFLAAHLPRHLGSPCRAGQVRTNTAGMALVAVPAGRFSMGSPPDEAGREADEGPAFEVALGRGFWIGKHEVTKSDFHDVTGKYVSGWGPPVVRDLPPGTVIRFPADVRHEDAQEFCRLLTRREREAGQIPPTWRYRLPTESEWEYACRAGTSGSRYGALEDIAWYEVEDPREVGRKAPNAWGLHDTLGNLAEHVRDCYYPNHVGAPTDGRARGGCGPKGRWVIRGGFGFDEADRVRAAARDVVTPDDTAGFRVVLAPEDSGTFTNR